jgi:hypothetical protein
MSEKNLDYPVSFVMAMRRHLSGTCRVIFISEFINRYGTIHRINSNVEKSTRLTKPRREARVIEKKKGKQSKELVIHACVIEYL